MGKHKAQGEDGIPSEVFKSVVEILPRYMTAIYNGCSIKEHSHRGEKSAGNTNN